MNRQPYWVEKLSDFYGTHEKRTACSLFGANVISSEIIASPGMHAPVLDIDFAAELLPSSTPGHFHLYLDTVMPWRRYRRLLKALARAGVIERGFYRQSKERRASFVRKPGVTK